MLFSLDLPSFYSKDQTWKDFSDAPDEVCGFTMDLSFDSSVIEPTIDTAINPDRCGTDPDPQPVANLLISTMFSVSLNTLWGDRVV